MRKKTIPQAKKKQQKKQLLANLLKTAHRLSTASHNNNNLVVGTAKKPLSQHCKPAICLPKTAHRLGPCDERHRQHTVIWPESRWILEAHVYALA
jgi:hypothetical protein